jgi:hypothetical protein
MVGRTYCRDCRWAARDLGVPYRVDPIPTWDTIERLIAERDDERAHRLRAERRIETMHQLVKAHRQRHLQAA